MMATVSIACGAGLLFAPISLVVFSVLASCTCTGRTAPLILEPGPGVERSAEALEGLAKKNIAALKQLADINGGLLFRGWGMASTEDFERVLKVLGLEPTPFFGQAPRKPLGEILFRNVAFEAKKGLSYMEQVKTKFFEQIHEI